MFQLAKMCIYATQAVYGVIAGYFFANPQSVFSDDGIFLGILALASGAVVAAPALLQRIPRLRERASGSAVIRLEGLLATVTLLAWIGTFGLFRKGVGYDSFVHFTASAFGISIALLTLSIFYPNISMMRQARLVVLLLGIVFAGGVINELFEKFGDAWWGTEMYGEWGDPRDTERDLVYDALGAFLGATLMLRMGKRPVPQTS